jgi:hypothetical protein
MGEECDSDTAWKTEGEEEEEEEEEEEDDEEEKKTEEKKMEVNRSILNGNF